MLVVVSSKLSKTKQEKEKEKIKYKMTTLIDERKDSAVTPPTGSEAGYNKETGQPDLDSISMTTVGTTGAGNDVVGTTTSSEASPVRRRMSDVNVIFDFDSTVINNESLEMMLSDVLGEGEEAQNKMALIEEWTRKGMNGECSFGEGLNARLKIAAPTMADVTHFHAKYCPSAITVGMKELIDELHALDANVFILSGGFVDVILPFAEYLNVPAKNVFAVEINWNKETGAFESLNEDNGFVTSKLEGAKKVAYRFQGKHTVAVGDGFTDYMLYKEGLAQSFVAYTEHAAREKVMSVAPACAASSEDLKNYLMTTAGVYKNE